MEGWAVGALNEAPSIEAAHAMLMTRKGLTLIDLAMLLEMKGFIGHYHCKSLMDHHWRGGLVQTINHQLPEAFSWSMLTLHLFFPWASHTVAPLEELDEGETNISEYFEAIQRAQLIRA